MANSSLDALIPPEVKDDEFYSAIQEIAANGSIKTILEIGSSSGGGSTEAFVIGSRQNPHQPMLFCMEISKTRFRELKNRYQDDTFVKCYNCSSVSISDFPTPEKIEEFYTNTQTNLNGYPLEEILGWLKQDIEYVQSSNVPQAGIQLIKAENNIEYFDLVLIDGSEFTGKKELEDVYGAKYILLDDTNTFKNYFNYQFLLHDPNYKLLKKNVYLRNGYAVFGRVDTADLNHLQFGFNFNEEKSEQLLVRRLVRPGMTVFDVGANLGDYSILLSSLVGENGCVYAFEPTSTIYARLDERTQKHKNIRTFRNAVFSVDGQIEFNEFPDEYSVWNSIGKPQMLNPTNPSEYVPIINSENVESIALDTFCINHNIGRIDYLKIDVEGAEKQVLLGAKKLLSQKNVGLIQFEISQKMLEGIGQTATEVFQLLEDYGYECHRILENGKIGEQVFDSNSFYENYIAFPDLPIHFFTIVLNGDPFIRYHIDVFKELPFQWHWHIIEGVADLTHDTAWSVQAGGRIPPQFHNEGRSIDGTTEYIDCLVAEHPENITVYRKPEGHFWDGKLEMVNAPLSNIHEKCLLWQIDADELWTREQICKTRDLFNHNPDKTAAFYWCSYFVGADLVISSRYCYAQNPEQEWLRTWRYKPGQFWVAHEPPILAERTLDDQLINVATINPLKHEETEAAGLVFQHFAYATESQVRFKESYYGYKNAVENWQRLQVTHELPVLLKNYFPWVGDQTKVDRAENHSLIPLAKYIEESSSWMLTGSEEIRKRQLKLSSTKLTVVIDAVFFQLFSTGIARVWRSILHEWSRDSFGRNVIVLDRGQTAPIIPGIRYQCAPLYDYDDTNKDRQILQQICDELEADIFISTYYTTPLRTPSVIMIYDMIPEVLGGNLNEPMWREKHFGIEYASAHIAISNCSAQDLSRFFPKLSCKSINIAYCGVDPNFCPADPQELLNFNSKYGITRPYFLLVGAGSGTLNTYKNTNLFFEAFAKLPIRQAFDIVCTGGGAFSPEFREYTMGSAVHMLRLEDAQLRLAYAGAVALVYPSKYEGFGMPIVEAMACGCPVITSPNASIPEVAGDAAIYIADDDSNALADALCEVQKPDLRALMIEEGFTQSRKFSWDKMSSIVKSVLINESLHSLCLRENNVLICPDWSIEEHVLVQDLSAVLGAISQHTEAPETTLLVAVEDFSEEEANLLIAGIAMHLCLESGINLDNGPEVMLFTTLHPLQYQALGKRLKARIQLQKNNFESLVDLFLKEVPLISLSDL